MDRKSTDDDIEQKIEQEEESTGGWVIPYGNLMTVLMIFFFLLYAFTFLEKKSEYERGILEVQKEAVKKGSKLREKIEKKEKETEVATGVESLVSEKGLDRFVKVSIDAQKIRITLDSPILYPKGKAIVKDRAKTILHGVADLIKTIENSIIIEGHTCNLPIHTAEYTSNWELSVDRAINVINYFIDEEKISPERFSAAGYGEHRPLYPNDTEENRAKNRRIEILILR